MGLKFFLVWKNWASDPIRIVLTLIGVALGVAVVSAIHVLDHSTILSQMERKRGDFGRVDLELRPLHENTPLEKHRELLVKKPGIDLAGLFCMAWVDLVQEESKPGLRAALYGLDPLGEKAFGHYRVARGKDISNLSPTGTVLLSGPLAEILQVEPGDSFTIAALDRAARATCNKGKLIPPSNRATTIKPPQEKVTVAGILAPFRLARQHGGLAIIGHFSLARSLANPFLPCFQVKRSQGTDPDRLAATLKSAYQIVERRAALIGEGADERAFRNGVKVLGCLALALGMFVIFHTLAHSLTEKIRKVGVLRCLGCTHGQLATVFLADAFVLSLGGTGAGLGLGVLLARLLASMEITTLGLGKSVALFEIPWAPLLAIGGLAIFFTMLGAAFPLLKIRGLTPKRILFVRDLAPPADLMRGVNLFLFTVLILALPLVYLAMTPLLSGAGRGAGTVFFQAIGLIGLFFAIILLTPRLVHLLGALPLMCLRPFWPLPTFLVHKNLLRSPGRLASAVCGLTLVALAMVGLKSLTASLKEEIHQFADRGLTGHLFLHSTPLGKKTVAEIRQLPDIIAVHPLGAMRSMPFPVIGTRLDELAKPGGPLAGNTQLETAMSTQRGLIISRRLSHLRNLKRGDIWPVATDQGKVQYQVKAISDLVGFFPDTRAVALADERWLHQDFCIDTTKCGRFDIRLKTTCDQNKLRAELTAIITRAGGRIGWLQTGKEIEQRHVYDVDCDFLFFDILLGLLLLLAGTGQVNLLTLTAIARRREIGVLRALGLTRTDYLKILLTEAGIIGFISGLLTLLAGIPLCWVLIAGLRSVSGLDVPHVTPWNQIAIAAAISMVVSLLSALPPAFKATGAAPAQAVRSTA